MIVIIPIKKLIIGAGSPPADPIMGWFSSQPFIPLLAFSSEMQSLPLHYEQYLSYLNSHQLSNNWIQINSSPFIA